MFWMITCVNVDYILDVSEPLAITFLENEVTNISTNTYNTSPNEYSGKQPKLLQTA